MPTRQEPDNLRTRLLSLSTRAELLILLLCVIVPFFGLIVYGVVDRYQFMLRDVRHDALVLARSVGDRQSAFVLHTRLLLKALANDVSIQHQDWRHCRAILHDFHERFGSFYSNIHVAKPNGDVMCSGVSSHRVENVGDRKGFQQAVATGKLVIGDLTVSRITGLQTLNMRYPVKNAKGEVIAVLTAQISAERFHQMVTKNINLPNFGEIIVSSFDNEIILNYPNDQRWLGKALPQGPLSQAISSGRSGIVEAAGLDGVTRIYAYARMGEDESDELRIAVGFPLEVITNNVHYYVLINVLVVVLTLILVAFIAWFGVERVVLSKIRSMVDTVVRFKSGERSARTGIKYGKDELSHIARAIDDMAAELETVMDVMREQAIRDPLTKLYNRRFMEECLMRGLANAQRQQSNLGVIIADLDHFKRFNDSYGHECGDLVLARVAETLMKNVRAGDVVCRFGGEEFAIIMQDATEEAAYSRTEMLRRAVREMHLEYNGEAIPSVTASFGLAVYPLSGSDMHSLLTNADAALYAAKRAGRNRVIKAPPLDPALQDNAQAPQ